MSVQRSPPNDPTRQLNPPSATTHYNSDSALDISSKAVSEELYLNVTKRQKRMFEELDHPSPSMPELKTLFLDMKDQQDQKFEVLNNALITIMTQNQDIKNSITTLTRQNDQLQSEIKDLKEENKQYKTRLSKLESQLDMQEKKSYSSMIEIRNLPTASNQNKNDLISIIQNIGLTIGLDTPIQESEIKDIYRRKSEAVVVDFSTTIRKEAILRQYKIYNKLRREQKLPQLQTEHIQLPSPAQQARIYMSEYLSSKTRQLFYNARINVKTRKIFAAWTTNGSVYVKKHENSSPTRIDDESELHKLLL